MVAVDTFRNFVEQISFAIIIDEQQDDMQTHTVSFYENSEGTNDELINFISKPSFFPYKTVNDNKTTNSHQKFNYIQKMIHGKLPT